MNEKNNLKTVLSCPKCKKERGMELITKDSDSSETVFKCSGCGHIETREHKEDKVLAHCGSKSCGKTARVAKHDFAERIGHFYRCIFCDSVLKPSSAEKEKEKQKQATIHC